MDFFGTHLAATKQVARTVYESKRLQRACTSPEKWLYRLGILPVDRLSLPDFLGIGAVKAGSTWLYRNLRAHPEVYMAGEKEISYFNRGFHKPLSSYMCKFKEGRTMTKGEITPGYATLPLDRIRYIRHLMPELKLIIILRNPIERAWSHALFRMVRIRKIPYERLTDSDFYAQFRSENSREQGNYRKILDSWLAVFPREQLYVGYFEDLLRRPRDLLTDVFRLIDVSTEVNWDGFPYDQVIYGGPGISMPGKYREFLNAMYRDEIESLQQRLDAPAAEWLDGRRDP